MAKRKPIIDEDATASAAELGRLLRLRPTSVSRLGGDGVLVRADERGQYRLWPSIARYVEHLRKGATGRDSETSRQRARLLKAQADKAESENAKASGKLVDRDHATAVWSSVIAHSRNEILRIPSVLMGRLPQIDRMAKVLIDAELRRILTNLSQDRGIDQDANE